MNGLSLCSGVGGLDLGLRRATGGRLRCVGYVERDAFAAQTLVARMEDSQLDRAPVFDDLESFPGHLYRGRVDLITAGFPCQPFSAAGKKLGTADPRWLWPHVLRILVDTGAPLLFIENVSGFTKAGLEPVLRDLAEAGFDAEWLLCRASDVGAPHRRERFFLLAWSVADAGNRLVSIARWGAEGRDGARSAGEALADADRRGCEEQRLEIPGIKRGERGDQPLGRDTAGCGAAELGDADCARLEGDSATRGGRAFPPSPSDEAGWREYIARGGAEPVLRRGAHGLAFRVDRLRCLGNAVVPAQAELAFTTLVRRALSEEQV